MTYHNALFFLRITTNNFLKVPTVTIMKYLQIFRSQFINRHS